MNAIGLAFAPSSKKVSARRLWLASLKPNGRTNRLVSGQAAPLGRFLVVLRYFLARVVHVGQAGLSLGISLFGRVLGLLDVFRLAGRRGRGGQNDQGNEEKYQLPSAGVSIEHSSHQTPPKSLSFAEEKAVSRPSAYQSTPEPAPGPISLSETAAPPLWASTIFDPDPRQNEAHSCPVLHLLEV